MSDTILQVAAKAVIYDSEGRILVVRESKTHSSNVKGGLYGTIGGRMEPGESFMDCLKREVYEEVGLDVEPLNPVYLGEWYPEIAGIKHHIVAIFIACRALTKNVILSTEHDDFCWVENITEMKKVKIMQPDDQAIIRVFEQLAT